MKITRPLQSVFPKRDALVRRDFTVSSQIPYTAQVAEHLVRTKWGDYVQVFRLAGTSFESADDGELNNWHERLAIALRNIASPNVALWTHIIRRRERSGGINPADALAALDSLRLEAARMVQQPLNPAVLEAAPRSLVRARDGR